MVDPTINCVAKGARDTVIPLTSVALPGNGVAPFDRMTPPSVPVTYCTGTAVEYMEITVAGKLVVVAGISRGIVVVKVSPETTIALPEDVSTKRDLLLQIKPSIVIALGNENDPSKLVQITLPFAAFDLEASYPIYSKATPYFSIRRAANDTQYTLGRAFLQEAYVIADYERSNFSVYQTFFGSQSQQIVAIHPPNSTLIDTSPSPNKTLGAGAIASIVIGALAAAALLGGLVWFFCRRRKRDKSEPKPGPVVDNAEMEKQPVEYYQDDVQQKPLYEMEHKGKHDPVKVEEPHAELDSVGVHLMSDDVRQYEMLG